MIEWDEDDEMEPRIELSMRIILRPGYGVYLTAGGMDLIGYTPDVDPNWPSCDGILKQAAEVLRNAGYDLSGPGSLKLPAESTLEVGLCYEDWG